MTDPINALLDTMTDANRPVTIPGFQLLCDDTVTKGMTVYGSCPRTLLPRRNEPMTVLRFEHGSNGRKLAVLSYGSYEIAIPCADLWRRA